METFGRLVDEELRNPLKLSYSDIMPHLESFFNIAALKLRFKGGKLELNSPRFDAAVTPFEEVQRY